MTIHEPGLHDYPSSSEPPEPPQPPRKRWYQRRPTMTAPSVAVRPYHGLAIAGFAVSIVAVILGLIPILFLLAWAGGAIGVTFGILGRRWRLGKAAIALSIVALALGVAGVVIVNNATTKLNHDLNSLTQPPVATTQTPTPQSTTGSLPEGQPQPKATGVPLAPPPTEQPKQDYNATFGVPYQVTGTNYDDTPYGATFTVGAPTLDYSFFDGMEKPKAGQYVSFSVHLKAATDGFDYNQFDWYVRGANGEHYDPASMKEPQLHSGTAHIGEQVTGYITFDAPRHGTLVYAPGSESVREWPF